MDDPGDVAENRQQDIEPEVQTYAHLQEYSERRQQDGKYDSDDVHVRLPVG